MFQNLCFIPLLHYPWYLKHSRPLQPKIEAVFHQRIKQEIFFSIKYTRVIFQSSYKTTQYRVSIVTLECRQPAASPAWPATMITVHLIMQNANDTHLNSNKRKVKSHLVHVNYVLFRGEYFCEEKPSSKLQLSVCSYQGYVARRSTHTSCGWHTSA